MSEDGSRSSVVCVCSQMWCHRHVFCVTLVCRSDVQDSLEPDLSGLAERFFGEEEKKKNWFESDFKTERWHLGPRAPHSPFQAWYRQSDSNRDMLKIQFRLPVFTFIPPHPPPFYRIFPSAPSLCCRAARNLLARRRAPAGSRVSSAQIMQLAGLLAVIARLKVHLY